MMYAAATHAENQRIVVFFLLVVILIVIVEGPLFSRMGLKARLY